MLVSNREGKGAFHSHLSSLLGTLLPAMIEQASHNPYPITSKSPHLTLSSPIHAPPPEKDQEKAKSLTRKKGKKNSGSVDMLDTIGGAATQPRGRGFLSPQATPDGKGGARLPSSAEKHLKRSMSSDAGFSSPQPLGFHLPEEVMVFPVLEKLEEEGAAQWDFYLLTEEEVRERGVGGREVG